MTTNSLTTKRSPLVWITHLTALGLVLLWIIPTAGILITSLRDKSQIDITGWWTSLMDSERNFTQRTQPPSQQKIIDGQYVLMGNLFEEAKADGTEVSSTNSKVIAFGWRAQNPTAFTPNQIIETRPGVMLEVLENGDYKLTSDSPIQGNRGTRIFYRSTQKPVFTLENYKTVLFAQGLGQSFINTFTVTIPATIIPILVAAFCAYALAWMEFPGRIVLISIIVGLLVVPLQLALIPLLQFYNVIGIGKSYLSIWLAHTGFGLPLAIYLLRNYIVGLPREIIESARIDGATEFDIFVKIILPLSFPALASFAIFQFLWVWNDLLIATVFLSNNESQLVMTGRLRELLGSYGGNWEILSTSAFVTIVVPLAVFFLLQRYLVRGLLVGSVKG